MEGYVYIIIIENETVVSLLEGLKTSKIKINPKMESPETHGEPV